MSIVIMSRKVKAKQNLSNKNDGFSLKGTRRNLRNIGSDCKNHQLEQFLEDQNQLVTAQTEALDIQ